MEADKYLNFQELGLLQLEQTMFSEPPNNMPRVRKSSNMELSSHSIATELKSRLTKPLKEPLEFISISNPAEIRIRRNQQKIKRHAAQIRSKKGSKRGHLISQVFEIAIPQSEAINLHHDSTAIPLQNWTEDANGQQIQALMLSRQGLLHTQECAAVDLQKLFGPLTTLILVNSPVSNDAPTIGSGDKYDVPGAL